MGKEAKRYSELVSFLSAFEESGELAQVFQKLPLYEPRYQGDLSDLVAQADFLYHTRRHLTLDALRDFRRELGVADLQEPLHLSLIHI